MQRLVLVGGFGDSQYLYDRLRDWNKKNRRKMSVVSPENPYVEINKLHTEL